jgi:TfoX/Sxy family transcriptional regulator of competence genes
MSKWKKSSGALVEKFHNCMDVFEELEPRKMFGYLCRFLNGNMLTGLHEENWVLRLAEEDREEIQKLGAKPFEPMGRKMREYVLLPTEILVDEAQLKAWIKRSIAFVDTLPPK